MQVPYTLIWKAYGHCLSPLEDHFILQGAISKSYDVDYFCKCRNLQRKIEELRTFTNDPNLSKNWLDKNIRLGRSRISHQMYNKHYTG